MVQADESLQPELEETHQLPTPQTSESHRSSIPPIPLLALPRLGPSPSALLQPAQIASSIAPTSPSSSRPVTPSAKPIVGLSDPFQLDESTATKGKVVRTGSVKERQQAMMDRIKSRSGKQPTLGSAIGSLDKIRPARSSAAQIEELKRRSTLSRLEGIAEGVWMMFSAPSPGPNTLPTPPRGRRKAIPLSEAAEVIVKSSKTPISLAEAQDSLRMLTELCPFFLTVKVVARQDWLEMPSAFLATCPTSPGASSTPRMSPINYSGPSSKTKYRIPPMPTSPSPGSRMTIVPRSPSSPSSRERDATSPTPSGRGRMAPPSTPPSVSLRRTMEPREPVSPTFGRSPKLLSSPGMDRARMEALAGPASPGRVRRGGGLRAVRERIRRELGE